MCQGVIMSLSKTLEEIKKYQVHANENLDEGPRATLSGRRGRQAQAKEQIKNLREEYIGKLMRSTAFIIVTGSGRDAFSSVATEEFNCFNADPEAFYKELSSKIPAVLYSGKPVYSSTFDVLGRHLEDKANELGIVGYPMLVFKQQYSKMVNNLEEFTSVVKQAINEQVGSEIAGITAVRSVVDGAIAKGHSAKITPIVLNTSDDKLAVDLLENLGKLGSRAFLIVAGKATKALKAIEGAILVKEASKETVEQALTLVSNSVKR